MVEDQGVGGLVRAPELLELRPDDPFFEQAQEISELITHRAYELFEAKGSTHGHDREDWDRAQSEILLRVPVEVTETTDQFTVRADIVGFTDRDIEVRVGSRSLCITGRRPETWAQRSGTTLLSERRPSRIFRVLELPVEVDSDRVNARLTEGVLDISLTKAGTGKKITVLTKTAGAA